MNEALFNWNGSTISYRKKGTGPLVVFLHGFGMDSHIWDRIISGLNEQFCYLLPDIPGSGKSDLPKEWTIEFLAEAINALIDEIIGDKKEQTVLVGHSMGGYIGLALAEKYPEKIKALSLFHSTTYADDQAKKEARKKSIEFIEQHGSALFIKQFIPNLFAENNRLTKTAEINELIGHYTNFSAAALVGYYEAMMLRKDRTFVLKTNSHWFQFIIGEQDKAIVPSHALEQAAIPSRSSIHLLENVGHMGMIEEPNSIISILDKFLQTIGNSRE